MKIIPQNAIYFIYQLTIKLLSYRKAKKLILNISNSMLILTKMTPNKDKGECLWINIEVQLFYPSDAARQW